MPELNVASYLMNPAEDEIRFGDELTEGMWVLPEDRRLRPGGTAPEDVQLRGQRFRRVTRLSRKPASGFMGPLVVFIGEWVDGYQEVHKFSTATPWLVKKTGVRP